MVTIIKVYSGEARANSKGVHLPSGCINICSSGCIYGEILIKSTNFLFFGGAFAPIAPNVASPLKVYVDYMDHD